MIGASMSWLVAQIVPAIILSLAGPNAQDSVASGTVTGKVFAPTYGTIADATVTLSNTVVSASGPSDASGAFSISVPPGHYTLRAVHPGFESGTVAGLDVEAGALVRPNIVLHSVEDAELRGRITDDAGKILGGVPHVQISARTSSRASRTISGSSGLYRLSLVPGTYSLEYRLAGFETQKYEGVVVARAHAARDVVLKAVGPPVGLMAPGIITGEIKDEGGSPARTTFVTVDTISHPDWSWKVRTDQAGRYRVQVPPGDYAVWYWQLRSPGDEPGWGNQARHHLTLESGQTAVIDATLEAVPPVCSDCPARPTPYRTRPYEVVVQFETALGSFAIAVDPTAAPITAANFLRYVDSGLYSSGRFHRATRANNYTAHLPNRPLLECVQAGIDPDRRSQGFEPIPLERTEITGIRHVVGTVSMARGAAGSATSDFFILLNDQPSLDFGGKRFDDEQGVAAFGRVVAGMDVVRKIQQQPTNGQSLAPPVAILKAARVKP